LEDGKYLEHDQVKDVKMDINKIEIKREIYGTPITFEIYDNPLIIKEF
jgi:hypothetical protein